MTAGVAGRRKGCARRGCGAVVAQPSTGRPRLTCSARCRAALFRARRAKRPAVWSSDSVEWYTPRELFETIAAEHGPFDLDPCADPRSPIWPLVPAHWTREDDGLAQAWHGRVFLNPPYGRAIAKWTHKAALEVAAGRASLVACLVPARTDTAWWHAAKAAGAEATYLAGRVRFMRPDGTRGDSAGFPSAVLVFRDAASVTKQAVPR